MENKFGLALEDAKEYIYSIDFSQIINKMVKHQGWLRKDAEKLCAMYRNFLYLNKKYAGMTKQLPPSEEIDEFWHNHILDTKKYRKDCEFIFGEYMDHYPYFGIDGTSNLSDLNTAFDNMQHLYEKEFKSSVGNVRLRAPFQFFKKIICVYSDRTLALLNSLKKVSKSKAGSIN